MDRPWKKQKSIESVHKVLTDKNLVSCHIAPYLSPLCFWALRNAYPPLKCTITFFDKFIDVLSKHLAKKVEGPFFLEYFNHCALTGGFLIGVLYNEYNNESDVDVLHLGNFNLHGYGKSSTDHSCVAYYEILYPMIDTIVQHGTLLQLIGIKCDFKTYVAHFDLPFCSMYFHKGHLYTKCKKEDLIKKKFDFNPDTMLMQVSTHPTLYVTWIGEYVAKRLLERIIKYTKRGFDINVLQTDYMKMLPCLEKNVPMDSPGNDTKDEKGRLQLAKEIVLYWSGFWDGAGYKHFHYRYHRW